MEVDQQTDTDSRRPTLFQAKSRTRANRMYDSDSEDDSIIFDDIDHVPPLSRLLNSCNGGGPVHAPIRKMIWKSYNAYNDSTGNLTFKRVNRKAGN